MAELADVWVHVGMMVMAAPAVRVAVLVLVPGVARPGAAPPGRRPVGLQAAHRDQGQPCNEDENDAHRRSLAALRAIFEFVRTRLAIFAIIFFSTPTYATPTPTVSPTPSPVASPVPVPVPVPSPAASPAPAPPPDPFHGGKSISGFKAANHVTFTFDDGPDYHNTPAILDALDAYNIKATFFVCGYRFGGKSETAQKNRETLAEIVKRGHLVGNHTWNHLVLPQQQEPKLSWEIDKNAELIERETGRYPYLFRPPFGSLSPRIAKALAKRGLTTVMWSSDSADTKKPFKTEKVHKAAIKGILKNSGGVVLFHDTHKWTAKAIPLVLADLQAENCRRLAASEPVIEVVNLDHFFIPKVGGEPAPSPTPEISAQRQAWRSQLETACKVASARND